MKHIALCLSVFLVASTVVGCSAIEVTVKRAATVPPVQPATASENNAIGAPSPTPGPDPTVMPTIHETATPTDTPSDRGNATSEGATYKTYTVKAGDTLWGIAIAHGVSLEALMTANGIKDPDAIWAGQELAIPDPQAAAASVPTTPPAPASASPDRSRRNSPTLPPPYSGALSESSRSGSHAAGSSGVGARPATDLRVDQTARMTFRESYSGPTPVVEIQPLQDQALLEPMLHDWQKMNNCAPTTVGMALSYYDLILTQAETAPALKGGAQDKNVSPAEIVAYLHDQGFGSIVRVNGDFETLQRLISNQIPVIVEQWLDRPDDELTGHYRLVRGYDQTSQEIIVNDSYSGPNLRFSYAEFDRLWRAFNRVYIPVYRLEREPVVRAILGSDWDDSSMYASAAERAHTEINTLNDAYAWFNLGSSLLSLGHYERAAEAYDNAIKIGLPPRMFWYQFGAFEAYNRTGQFERVLELSAPLTNLALEELHYQRGVAYEELGQRVMALAEYQRALELNPRLDKAQEAIAQLRRVGGGG